MQELLFPGLHLPGRHEASLRSLGTSALYTPEERHFFTAIYETSMVGQMPLRAPEQKWQYTPHFFVIVPATALPVAPSRMLQVLQSVGLELQPFYGQQCNLHLSARTAILFAAWGAWMHLQSLHGRRPTSVENMYFRSPMVLVCFKLLQDRVWNLLQSGQVNFWNRVYQDYHLHVTSGHLLLQPDEQATVRYFTFGGMRLNFSEIAVGLFRPCPTHRSLHPSTGHVRFMHQFAGRLRTSLVTPDHPDFRVPSELVLQFRRSRL
eukprot:Skav216569  [mRNA]  locus=scaffold2380:3405:4193:+ [translate_table: standard]